MSRGIPVPLLTPGTKNPSNRTVGFLVHECPSAPPGNSECGVPVLTIERKRMPEGVRSEIAYFNCSCDPPLSCLPPSWHGSSLSLEEEPDVRIDETPRPRSAKQRRQRRRDLASGAAQPTVAKGAAQR